MCAYQALHKYGLVTVFDFEDRFLPNGLKFVEHSEVVSVPVCVTQVNFSFIPIHRFVVYYWFFEERLPNRTVVKQYSYFDWQNEWYTF